MLIKTKNFTMHLKTLLLSVFAIVLSGAVFGQDKIYTHAGDIITAKVKEVGTKTIIYKRADNPDGPEYTIRKNEVDRIKYENGTVDEFDEPKADAHDRHPSRAHTDVKQSKINYGNNIISFAPVIFTNDNVQSGEALGFSYERVLDKDGMFSFVIPVAITFSGTYNQDNLYSSGYSITGVGKPTTAYYFTPGFKFYPTGNRGIVRYGVGPSLYLALGSQNYQETVYDPGTGNPTYQYINNNYTIWGIMINNSLNIYPSKHLFVGMDLGLGIAYSKPQYYPTDVTLPLAQFAFRVGYRF